MLKDIFLSFSLITLLFSGWGSAFSLSRPKITQPLAGEAIQGQVAVVGSTNVSGFESAEVAFAYETGEDPGWFLIAALTYPVEDGTLTVWDTTGIADGSYSLRVKVLLKDGRSVETVITGLRVRNYSPIETPTPSPLEESSPGEISSAPMETLVILPSATPLPSNPAEISPPALVFAMTQGVVIVVVVFIVVGIYLLFRSLSRRY
jgi:hypothetical protein